MPVGGWTAAAVVAALLLAVGSTGAAAQAWSLHAAVGQIHGDAMPADVATGGWIGVARTAPRTSLAVTGGAPFDGETPYWAMVAARADVPLRRSHGVSWSLRTSGSAYGYTRPGTELDGVGASGELAPSLRFDGRRAWFRASSGPAAFAARDGAAGFRRTVLSSRVEVTGVPAAGLRIGAALRHVLAGEAGYLLATATGSAARGPVRAWVTAGGWMSGGLDEPLVDAGVRMAIADRLGITGRYHLEPPDPLLWNDTRRGVSLGVDLRLGAPAERRDPPSGPIRTNGETVFRVPARVDRDSVWIAGDFTRWERVPMQRAGDHWFVKLAVPRGVHRYAFVDDRDRWFLPPGTRTVDDGMGGESGILLVD